MKDSARHSTAAFALTVFSTVCWTTFLVTPALTQVQGKFAGVSQCWNGSSWVTVQGNCSSASAGGGTSPSSANSVVYNGFYQLGYQFGQWLFGGGSNSQATAQQRVLEQQMMAEIARRQAEAQRLHQEEEARRLAEMYNRLAYTLKHRELPDLQTKERPGSGPGLQLKLRDSAAAQAEDGSSPGFYLNDQGKWVLRGISGLPGVYAGEVGQGAAQTSGQAQNQTPPALAMKTRDSEMAASQNAAPAPAPPEQTGQPAAASAPDATQDPNKMTAQQLADAADAFSKLPPEEQQRILAEARQSAAAQPVPGMTGQPSTQALTPLQRQADASQAAAAASGLEEASAKARVGFDQPLGPPPVKLEGANSAPSLLRSSATEITNARVSTVTPPVPGKEPRVASNSVKKFLFPGSQSGPFPRDPNPALTNPLREEQKVQAELKAWDDWAIQRAIHIHAAGDKLSLDNTELAILNASAVQQYAPELLARYNSDAAFRRSVNQRLQFTDESVALDYYQWLANAHKAAIGAFQAGLEKLAAAGKLDRLTPLEDQYRQHPERLQLVREVQIRVKASEQAAVAEAQADANSRLDKEYQFAFQLIRRESVRSK